MSGYINLNEKFCGALAVCLIQATENNVLLIVLEMFPPLRAQFWLSFLLLLHIPMRVVNE
jgi:hypothetical protein